MTEMRIIEPGHVYEFDNLDAFRLPFTGLGPTQRSTFLNREKGTEHPGIQTQDVIRGAIDRTRHCDNLPARWDGNDKIIYHLRMALALHESRALERKAEKGLYEPERILCGHDGHFLLGTE